MPSVHTIPLKDDEHIVTNISTCIIKYGESVTNIYKVSEKVLKEYYKHSDLCSGTRGKKAELKVTTLFSLDEHFDWQKVYVCHFNILIDNKIIDAI